MILESHNDISLIESDMIDSWGLPIYMVQYGTRVKLFSNGELAYTDAYRYFWDLALTQF